MPIYINSQYKYRPKNLVEFIFPNDKVRDVVMAYASGNNVVDEYLFGDHFQEALEGFADDEEASENNYQWGCLIAQNINLATTVKKSRRRKVANP